MKLSKFLERLFTPKYVSVYIALSDKECMNILGKLDTAGIKHYTKTLGIYGSSAREIGMGRKQSQYDIRVKYEDKYKAEEAIHR